MDYFQELFAFRCFNEKERCDDPMNESVKTLFINSFSNLKHSLHILIDNILILKDTFFKLSFDTNICSESDCPALRHCTDFQENFSDVADSSYYIFPEGNSNNPPFLVSEGNSSTCDDIIILINPQFHHRSEKNTRYIVYYSSTHAACIHL